MTPDAVAEVSRQAITTLIMVCGPLMLVALVVGLLVALFQTLTSIQEVTLTFVPKIIAVFAVMLLVMPFMASQLESLTTDLFARMTVQPTQPEGTDATQGVAAP
ncbi:MAG: flagellar biosynthesis protein FliQ [Alphaproteobacteria bacterium]